MSKVAQKALGSVASLDGIRFFLCADCIDLWFIYRLFIGDVISLLNGDYISETRYINGDFMA